MNLTNEIIIKQIFDFINKIIFFEKKNVFKFKDLKLYPSELHLILFIHHKQDTNATRMAEMLGLTKGAISQTLSRLEKKGVLRKFKDNYNKNELTIEFTPLGEEVLEDHLRFIAGLHIQHDQYLSSLTENERIVVKDFLSHIEGVIDQLMEKMH